MASTRHSTRKRGLKEVAPVGLDLAKMAVHFIGVDATGQVLTRRQHSKGKLGRTIPQKLSERTCWLRPGLSGSRSHWRSGRRDYLPLRTGNT